MQFDLNRFLTKGSEPVRREFALECSGEAFPGYTVDEPLHRRFTARLEAEQSHSGICTFGHGRAECARCLAPVAQSFEIAQQYERAPSASCREKIAICRFTTGACWM